MMEKVPPPRWTGWPLKVAGDNGYSYPHIREWLEHRIIEQVIPRRSDQVKPEGRLRLDRRAYKKRAQIEQRVGWIKENRPVGRHFVTTLIICLDWDQIAVHLRSAHLKSHRQPDRFQSRGSPA